MTVSTEAAVGTETGAIRSKPVSLFYPWLVVAFLMVLYTSSFIDRQILSLLVKPIRAEFGISDTQYSILTGLAFVTLYSLAGIPLGWIVDRWSRRLIIAIGVAAWSIMTAGCGLANSFGRLFAFRVGVGIGEATLSPAAYSLVSDLFPREKLGRALSLFALGSQIGSGLALVIGGSVIKALTDIGPVDLPVVGVTKPWQVVFLVIGLPGLILALLTLLVVREPRHKPAAGVADDGPTMGATLAYMWLHRRIYGSLFIGMGLIAMFGYASNAWYPTYLQRIHGYTIPQAGYFWGISTLVFGIIGAIAAGTTADRLIAKGRLDGHFRVTIAYGIGNAVCGVAVGLIPVPWLSLVFVVATGFFSNTLIGVIAAAIQTVTPARMRGKVSSFYLFTAAFIGMAFGPTAVGAATDHIFGYDNAVGYSIALVAFVFPTIGCLVIQSGRKAVLRHLAG